MASHCNWHYSGIRCILVSVVCCIQAVLVFVGATFLICALGNDINMMLMTVIMMMINVMVILVLVGW